MAGDAQGAGNPACGVDLDGVTLPVSHGQGIQLEAGGPGLCERRGRIQPSTEEHDRSGRFLHPLSFPDST